MNHPNSTRGALAALLLTGFLSPFEAFAGVPVDFNGSFSPNVIGPDSISTLTFTMDNLSGAPVMDLAFSNTLPMGLTVAFPGNASTTCVNAVLDAIDGASTFSMMGGRLGTNTQCTVQVDVTGPAGLYTNVSGSLSYGGGGTSPPVVADLNVDSTRPGFTKSFAPATINRGAVSTLTFTVVDPGGVGFFNFSFADALPLGMVVANPPNATTDCQNPNYAPTPGANVVNLSATNTTSGLTCTASVDVTTTAAGEFGNTTSVITSARGTGGKAGAVLTVELPNVLKRFVDDPAPPGGTVTLEYTLTNFNRAADATNITFDDDLDNALTGLQAVGLPLNNPCGAGSSLTGAGLLSLTGGSLPAQGSCTFTVDLQVPQNAAPGLYPSVSSVVTLTQAGQPVLWPAGEDVLAVDIVPMLTQEFTNDPLAAGDTLNLEFTILNPSPTETMSAIGFTEDFGTEISGLVAVAPAPGFCGAGSVMNVRPATDFQTLQIDVSGADLAAGASCTFSVTLDVPSDTVGRLYPYETSAITAMSGTRTVVGPGASDEATIVNAPVFRQAVLNNPAAPGGTVTLEYTFSYNENAPGDATNISFTEDYGLALPGLVATNLPLVDPCGSGSSLTGSSSISFTGGSLAPNSTCSFQVTLDVPANALPGSYRTATSNLNAQSLGVPVGGPGASADLEVTGFGVTAEFTDDPIVPGETVTLELVFANASSTAAQSITMQTNLSAFLPGVSVATTLPINDACGAGSTLFAPGNTLILIDGALAAGASCTISLVLQTPAGAQPTDYAFTTGDVTASLNGNVITVRGGRDILSIVEPLVLSKTFLDNPARPGELVRLEFVVTNNSPDDATQVAFTDNLVAQYQLAALGLPVSDVCGAGSTVTGNDEIVLADGFLGPDGSCTFSVDVRLPADLPIGASVQNVTGQVSASINGSTVRGAPASDELVIDHFDFTQTFTSSPTPGAPTSLVFSIEKIGSSSGAVDLRFAEELEPVLAGLSPTNLPLMDPCGMGSTVAGTDTLRLTSGNVESTGLCSFEVDLLVPSSAQPGTYDFTTSDLTVGGVPAAGPALATLRVLPNPAPTFGKTFVPDVITEGEVSTLTFTVDNSASTAPATMLSFTDNLPTGLTVADPSGATTDCTGGTLTAVSGTGVVSYAGGEVSAAAACTVEVSISGDAAGTHLNTTEELTSSAGASGRATATLTVNPRVDTDAGVPDAAPGDGGQPGQDAGVNDAGMTPDEEGCGCTAADESQRAWGGLSWLLFLPLLWRRKCVR